MKTTELRYSILFDLSSQNSTLTASRTQSIYLLKSGLKDHGIILPFLDLIHFQLVNEQVVD